MTVSVLESLKQGSDRGAHGPGSDKLGERVAAWRVVTDETSLR